MDRGLIGVAVDVATVGANYEFMVCRHQCDMRVNLKDIDTICIYIYIYIYIFKYIIFILYF